MRGSIRPKGRYHEAAVTVRDLRDADASVLERLVTQYPFKPYRHYRVWSRARQDAIMRAEVARSREVTGHRALVVADGDTVVVALSRPLGWDTGFFGVPMARLDWLLRGPASSAIELEAAVRASIERLRAEGIRHVTAKADVADMDLVAALEACGFRLMDALVTYFTHPRREAPTAIREVGRVRSLEAHDVDKVLAITEEAYAGFRGRFHLDPHLPPERTRAFYLEWARQCCAGRMADRVVVADNGHGGLHGWASIRRVEPASTAGGITLWAGSLGACRRDKPGAYAGLIRSLAAVNHAAGEVTETQTQNHNVATVRVYDAVGARYVRADYTFHAWLE
jgi:hypothetical protein